MTERDTLCLIQTAAVHSDISIKRRSFSVVKLSLSLSPSPAVGGLSLTPARHVSQLERSLKGQRLVSDAKRLGVAVRWAWLSDRSSVHPFTLDAT